MKKIVLIALPALALIASCSKTEVTPAQSDPQQISFFTLVNRQGTKADAIISGTAYPTDETFGTFAFFVEKGKKWADSPTSYSAYIPNSEVKNTTKATSGTVWTTDPAYYWPKQGSLTFFSYSPWDELNSITTCLQNEGIKISDWDVNGNQEVDVMVADIKTEQTKNDSNGGYTGVPTIFRHKLSQIVKFTFKTDEDYLNGHDGTTKAYVAGDKKFYINSIKINNLDYKGTYVSGNDVDGSLTSPKLGTWTVTNATTAEARQDYTWFEQATDDNAETGNNKNSFDNNGTVVNANKLDGSRSYLLVLPQEFTDVATKDEAGNYKKNEKNIQISYTISTWNGKAWVDEYVKDVYATLYDVHSANNNTNINWEMNKKISYTITISLKNDRIYWAPSVVEWDTTSFNDYVID